MGIAEIEDKVIKLCDDTEALVERHRKLQEAFDKRTEALRIAMRWLGIEPNPSIQRYIDEIHRLVEESMI